MQKKPSKLLLSYLSPFKWQLFGVFVALIFSSSSVLLLGKGLEFLVDRGFGEGNSAILDEALFFLFLIIFCLAIASFVRSSLIYILCEKLIKNLRNDLYIKMINLSAEFYETQKITDLFSRLSNDTTMLTSLIPNVTSVFLRHIITLIGAFSLLIFTSAKLTFYVLLIIPIAIIPIILIGRKLKKFAGESQEQISKVGERIEESLGNIKIVQAYNQQMHEIENFSNVAEDAFLASRKRIFTRSFLAALVICLVFSSIAFVLWVGGKDVISGKMSAGSLSSFIFYAILLAGSVASLTEIFGDLQRVFASSDRLAELFEIKPQVQNAENAISLKPQEKIEIEFKECNFAYPARKDKNVLENFSLKISSGEKVAIVGASGSGKTTIMQLLLRFYDVQNGEILINNVNIKNLTLESLRAQMAIVFQDPVIFSGTVYDNIIYGNLNASRQEVEQAASDARISDFIEDLPQKYETFVGEKGIRLSGGQKQRIIIARAILKNAPILLLDEATSALDSVNEAKVQEALERLMQNKTSIIIAHRLSTIENADKIIVIENGKILQTGKAADLMSQNGPYLDFAKKQTQN